MEERAAAAEAARALRLSIADPSTKGDESTVHIDFAASRKNGVRLPRRAVWITRWAGVPGFARVNGRFEHDCLPGWVYERHEVRREMIPDLEALAERGIRPTEVTNHG
jgi:hypothetical protein